MDIKEKKDRKDIKYFCFLICIYIFVFQDLLQNYISILKSFDEIFALLFFPASIIWLLKNKENLKVNFLYVKIMLCLIGIIIVGLYSNIYYKYQDTVSVLSDMLVVSKFILAFFVTRIIFGDVNTSKNKKRVLVNVKFIVFVMFLFTILNYVFDIFPGEYRYNIKANQLFYSHPTILVAVCIFLLGLIIYTSSYDNSIEGKRKYIVLLLLMILSTLRVKAIGFIVLFIVLYYVIIVKKKRITFSKITVLGSLLLLVSYQQIIYYFVELDDTARNNLLQTSFEISIDYFPIGTGFATYGSYFSGVNYSPIYYYYNLNNVYGLQEGAAFFISDNFWPMILGQFGIIGLLLFVYIIYNFLRLIQRMFNVNRYLYCSSMLALGYLIVSSVAESAFVHSIAIPLALLMAISIEKGNNNSLNINIIKQSKLEGENKDDNKKNDT